MLGKRHRVFHWDRCHEEMMNGLDFSALDHQGRVSLMKDGRECPCRLCTDAFYEYETRAMYEWIDQGDREDYRKLV